MGQGEKLCPRESSEYGHTVLRGAVPKDSVSILRTFWRDSFSSLPKGFLKSCSDYHNHKAYPTQSCTSANLTLPLINL